MNSAGWELSVESSTERGDSINFRCLRLVVGGDEEGLRYEVERLGRGDGLSTKSSRSQGIVRNSAPLTQESGKGNHSGVVTAILERD